MVDVNVNFEFREDEPLQSTFNVEPDVPFVADLSLETYKIPTHGELSGRDLPNQHPITAISGLNSTLSGLSQNITNEIARAEGVEQSLASSIESNHQAISNLNQSKVDKVNIANKVYGTDAQGNQTTYDKGSFGQVDDVQVNGVSVVTNKIALLGSMAGESKSNYLTSTQVANSIAVETNNRENADINLQSQIDAIVSASDVFDIVGTYAELQAYDISTVPVNDIIKVLVDSTHAGAATYYRCVETSGVKSWSYIGSEGAYYTKAEADSNFVPQTRTVNSKALSSDITLTASDVGALPSSTVIPTVNNGQLDIQVNGSSVAMFTANQSTNTTANIVVPDSATWGNVGGDIADQIDLMEALDGKQDLLTSENAGTNIEIVEGGSGEDVTVSGNGSVLLEEAVANGLNSVTLSGKCEQTYIPSDYVRTVSTANNATVNSRIDTGLIPQDGDVIELRITTNIVGVSFYAFQARSGGGSSIFGVSGSSSGSTISADWGQALNSGIARTAGHTYFIRISFVDGVKTIYVKDETSGTEDTQTGTYDATKVVPTTNYTLWGNKVQYLNRVNPVHEVKLTNNGVTRLHYIPCIYNNVAGFYDRATESFVTPETDVLTAGAVTPTPTNPLPIVCNNGEITSSKNMFRTNGSTTTQGGVTFAIQPDGSVECTGTATAYYSWYMGRADVNSDMGTVILSIDGVYNATGNIVIDKAQLYDGSASIAALNWTNWTSSLSIDLSQYPTVQSIRVWLKRNSNKVTNATIKAQVTKGSTSWKPYKQISVSGTVETVTDEAGNTATAERLLELGDYTDTQELLSGAVNRNVGIAVFTGFESWAASPTANNYYLAIADALVPTSSMALISTHYEGTTLGASLAPNNTIKIGVNSLVPNTGLIYIKHEGFADADEFKNYLQLQYANGTPVIVVYPIATETTETVTGQTLTTVDGDNTLSIQASIENLPIEANYTQKGGTVINVDLTTIDGFDATKTQILKHINGTLRWVDD